MKLYLDQGTIPPQTLNQVQGDRVLAMVSNSLIMLLSIQLKSFSG